MVFNFDIVISQLLDKVQKGSSVKHAFIFS